MGVIEKKFDGLGRVVIPIEYRKKLCAGGDNSVLVSMEGDRVFLASPLNRCALCSKTLESGSDIRLCNGCIEKVKAIPDKN